MDALTIIGKQQAVFVSRGDNSGTNKKEIILWKASKLTIPEKEKWYVQTGQGMLSTINIAAERNGYTMTDRGTYIKYESNAGGNPPLKILVEGDAILKNQYSVMAVNPKHCPKVKYEIALKFADWITGEKAQKLIGEFSYSTADCRGCRNLFRGFSHLEGVILFHDFQPVYRNSLRLSAWILPV